MKKLFPILMLIACTAFVACDDDDNDNIAVNQAIRSYIENKYPGADIRKAEKSSNGLVEVEFIHDSRLKEAYFNAANEWQYTEWDVAIGSLPANITNAIAANYPDFRIDDADYIESPKGTFYEIEIEKGNVEQWIFVTPEGDITSSAPENNTPTIISNAKEYVLDKYPGAVIRSAEYDDNGLIEVEFLHESIVKDAYFNSKGEWQYTEWDVAVKNLPQAVTSAVAAAYPDYRIDDADFIEKASGNYYKLDIEKGNYEILLFVTSDGNIITQ